MGRTPYDYAPNVVLFKETGEISSCGNFPDHAEKDEVWDEEQVRDFIRRSRPDLYQKLNQLPVATSHVAEPVDLGIAHLNPLESALKIQGNILDGETNQHCSEIPEVPALPTPQMRMYQQRTAELQHKRNLEYTVVGGQPLFLRKLRKPGHLLMCSAPACQHAIGFGGYFITVQGDPEIHYGLECLESLFAERKSAIRRAKDFFNNHALDGATDQVMPHNLPSNCMENRLLRQAKQFEIDAIIDENVQHQIQQRQASESGMDEDDSLHLRRPLGIEPLEGRYKKQGLTEYDRKVERKMKENVSGEITPADRNLHPADDGLELICYCRELKGEGDLIQCGYGHCLIGWFHVECCDDGTYMGGDFFCGFCSAITQLPSSTCNNEVLQADYEGGNTGSTDGAYWHESDAQYEDDVPFDEEDYEMYDTPIDESPRTPSPSPEAEPNTSSSNYLGSPTGFITINNRPPVEYSLPSTGGLDGAIESKSGWPKKIYSKVSGSASSNATETTFEDLAPFMVYKSSPPSLSGLQDSDILRFEGWRYCMPESKLLLKDNSGRFAHDLRHDIRALAEQWIDRTVQKGGRNVFKSLSKWLVLPYGVSR